MALGVEGGEWGLEAEFDFRPFCFCWGLTEGDARAGEGPEPRMKLGCAAVCWLSLPGCSGEDTPA